jgi:hypothetical protein
MHTPESIGSMMFGGRPRRDSGYALEEALLGGRLRHRHLVNHSLFVVSYVMSLPLKSISIIMHHQLIGTD